MYPFLNVIYPLTLKFILIPDSIGNMLDLPVDYIIGTDSIADLKETNGKLFSHVLLQSAQT